MRTTRKPLQISILGTALFAASGFCFAQTSLPNAKRGGPSSLPPVLSSASVHSTASTTVIPYADNPRDSLASLLGNTFDADTKAAPYSCKADSLVCYDYRKRQSVVPITKSMMPDVPGLKKEGVTVKRDKVAFNYSF
ncbi:MAG: hypothetical protein ING71_00555 [Rhodocyclaceae bacterium]|jgi:hypothetical protein|nr:hypothetical protein [Rhodocyclaceae bacterium]MCA3056790.1 hypothetical protein [Rhodocyclaceae bacterium]MCA3063684.1 hypothetical protein [Rhodocyclaceae bacterium]MCA3077267.1 hypothetical protein [Rhodocyclaceae bacterium]